MAFCVFFYFQKQLERQINKKIWRGIYGGAISKRGTVLTIRLPKEVDHHHTEAIRCEADRYIEQEHIRERLSLTLWTQVLWTVRELE